ncbi:hypothetical protein DRN73_02100 [Candidatus Pacearchaeota archaeon]|nr:MAG: hypothetical protein DRN73_02100 [Candidatus Pacearchaeota archaeon]
MRKKDVFLLTFLVLLLFIINYSLLNTVLIKFFNEKDKGIVERVIDGDTIVVDGVHIRLLGINSPEKGEEYSKEATGYLRDIIFNKTVSLEYGKNKKDKYGRTLAYVFLNNENINLNSVRNGFSNFYFPSGKDKHYLEFKNAWEKCLKDNKNLCEKSLDKCAECIELEKFDYKKEIVSFRNLCSFNCDLEAWEIKDEGRKKFIFPKIILNASKEISIITGNGNDNENVLFWRGKEYIWTKTGDTLFLRDKNHRLVLWKTY